MDPVKHKYKIAVLLKQWQNSAVLVWALRK
jgi:hypothetical protein